MWPGTDSICCVSGQHHFLQQCRLPHILTVLKSFLLSCWVTEGHRKATQLVYCPSCPAQETHLHLFRGSASDQLVGQRFSPQAAKHDLIDERCKVIPACVQYQPLWLLQVLTDHTDEVWHVAFSHNGTMLASASKDAVAIIYQVQRLEQRVSKQWVLTGHTGSIGYLAWSPDDSMLATCGNDMVLRLWSSSTGECLQEMSHHSKEVSSVAWLPDSELL